MDSASNRKCVAVHILSLSTLHHSISVSSHSNCGSMSIVHELTLSHLIYQKNENILKNEQKSRDAAAKKYRYKRIRDK